MEGRTLLLDDGTFGVVVLLTGNEIAESNVVVGYAELDGHLLSVSILKVDVQLGGNKVEL